MLSITRNATTKGDSVDGTFIVLMLFGWGVFLFALYFVITAAVAEGMKRHTRWQVANRDAIEQKYGQRPAS